MEQLLSSDDTYHLGWTTTASGLRDAMQEARTKRSIAGLEEPTVDGDIIGEEEEANLSKEELRRIKRLKRMKEVRKLQFAKQS